MAFSLPTLPYADNALEPHISAQTFSFHHGKHHQAYINKANDMIAGTEFEGKSAEEIIKAVVGKADKQGLFNNVAQHWNHSFFWESLSPVKQEIPAELEARLIEDFGSVESFKTEFTSAGGTQFGSGWAWLVIDETGKLHVKKTANANTPLTDGFKPLLTCDVWEHAYYLDYQNRRPDFLNDFVNTLANWEFALKNLKGEGFKL